MGESNEDEKEVAGKCVEDAGTRKGAYGLRTILIVGIICLLVSPTQISN